MTGYYVMKLDGELVLDYRMQADIWNGTTAEVRLDNAFFRFAPGQIVQITNEVDRYPEWVRRLVGRFQPGWRPRRVIYRLAMVIEWVTAANRVGLRDLHSWTVKNAALEGGT